jgi:nucleotide-binding universal stress UspA family protein
VNGDSVTAHLLRESQDLGGQDARSLNKETVVWIVTIMDPPPWEMGEPYLSQYIEQHTKAGQDLILEATTLIGPDVETHSELLFGAPAESILQFAETRECDLIVIGTRGFGLLEGLLLGTQARKVISHARCPVMEVK